MEIRKSYIQWILDFCHALFVNRGGGSSNILSFLVFSTFISIVKFLVSFKCRVFLRGIQNCLLVQSDQGLFFLTAAIGDGLKRNYFSSSSLSSQLAKIQSNSKYSFLKFLLKFILMEIFILFS